MDLTDGWPMCMFLEKVFSSFFKVEVTVELWKIILNLAKKGRKAYSPDINWWGEFGLRYKSFYSRSL